MTLKFPLINLISRGHLPLANATACLNFAKAIEDGPATRICYEMMKCDEPAEAARFLEEAVRVHREVTEGTPAYFSESTSFANARNMILMRESGSRPDENADVDTLRRTLKNGGIGAAALYIMSSGPRKRELLDALKKINIKAYNIIQNNYIGNKVLPQDAGYFKRLFNQAIGAQNSFGTTQWLKDAEQQSLNKFKTNAWKAGKWGVAIAAGITTAIVGISMIYKKHFSAEAKACKSFGGKDRTVCMTKARIKACDAAIAASKKALLDCGSAKNEEDCIFKMKVEIRSWSKKKAAEEEKLRKLTNVNNTAFDTPINKNDPFA